MVFSMKCPACGLMQMSGPTCKSCGRPLGGPAPRPSPPQHVAMEIPAKVRQMPSRKFLLILGAVLLVLLGWGTVGFGILKLWNYGSHLDAGSKSYVDDAIPKIVSSWKLKELLDRAGPELVAAAPSEKVEKLFQVFSARLGPLRSYEGSRGQARVFVSPRTGKVTTASYVAEAIFEKAKGSIQVELILRNGKWEILGFHVNSEALIL